MSPCSPLPSTYRLAFFPLRARMPRCSPWSLERNESEKGALGGMRLRRRGAVLTGSPRRPGMPWLPWKQQNKR